MNYILNSDAKHRLILSKELLLCGKALESYQYFEIVSLLPRRIMFKEWIFAS